MTREDRTSVICVILCFGGFLVGCSTAFFAVHAQAAQGDAAKTWLWQNAYFFIGVYAAVIFLCIVFGCCSESSCVKSLAKELSNNPLFATSMILIAFGIGSSLMAYIGSKFLDEGSRGNGAAGLVAIRVVYMYFVFMVIGVCPILMYCFCCCNQMAIMCSNDEFCGTVCFCDTACFSDCFSGCYSGLSYCFSYCFSCCCCRPSAQETTQDPEDPLPVTYPINATPHTVKNIRQSVGHAGGHAGGHSMIITPVNEPVYGKISPYPGHAPHSDPHSDPPPAYSSPGATVVYV